MAPALPRIASRTNPQFKALRALADSAAERRRQRRTLLDGAHLLAAYLQGATPLLIAVSDTALRNREVQDLLEQGREAPRICLAHALFEQIAPVQTPTGIVAVIAIPDPTRAPESGQFIVLLDGVQDPGNVGTIVRSAAAAGADAVLLSPACADAWSPRALRAGMGGQFVLQVHSQCDLLRAASVFEGRVVAAAGRGGLPPEAIPLTGKIALVFGAEGAGVSASLARRADAVVSIPLVAAIESLNVAAAAAVVLFERLRQQRTSQR